MYECGGDGKDDCANEQHGDSDDQDNDCSIHWRIASTSLHIIVLCHTLMCLRRVLVMLRSVSEVVLVQQRDRWVVCDVLGPPLG